MPKATLKSGASNDLFEPTSVPVEPEPVPVTEQLEPIEPEPVVVDEETSDSEVADGSASESEPESEPEPETEAEAKAPTRKRSTK